MFAKSLDTSQFSIFKVVSSKIQIPIVIVLNNKTKCYILYYDNLFSNFSTLKPQKMRFTVTADQGRYSWTTPWPIFDVKNVGHQTLTIPVSGNFKIEIAAPGREVKDSRGITMPIPGLKTVGTFLLKKGQKITVVLGQMANFLNCQSGGSLCVLEGEHGPEPLLIVSNGGNFSIDSYSKFELYLDYYGYCKIQRDEDQKL